MPKPPAAARSFPSAADFRRWLEQHHDTTTELIVCCFKKGAAHKGMTHPEALQEALCFGWIDGRVNSIDAERYTVRFSPRTARSIWSLVNVGHLERLIAEGRVAPAGMAVWQARDVKRTGIYAFEREAAAFTPAMTRRFKANRKAWSWYSTAPAYYRKVTTHWVTSARKEETRARRLGILIDSSSRGERIPGIASTPRQKK